MTQEGALADVSDEVLVQRAVDGDTEAFAALIRRHGPVVRALLGRLAGSTADGDELTQEAFFTAWRELPGMSAGADLRGWLLRIAIRLALTRLREGRNGDDVPAVDDEDQDAAASAHDETAEPDPRQVRTRALSGVLDALPDEERHCWLLREMGGLEVHEISELLGLTDTDVRARLAVARATIYTRMEEWR
ncbi:ECF RNA polymerase sigma-E factor [Microbacterium lemovicicum]|uniref:ECF RNA polymerase sigma-E factor n=1 Tax=Microbacterium lemovicicum TaxID=1072463 RepID=A0A3S9WDB9_9MICO|nr:RNA polymerase sigma factor [Microbacterium lemovicicum]AZS38044.1 ECF RNA polymerase sigma-E factor [Microbacterium lemovicicum]